MTLNFMKNFSYCIREYEVPRPFVAPAVPPCPVPAVPRQRACSVLTACLQRAHSTQGGAATCDTGTAALASAGPAGLTLWVRIQRDAHGWLWSGRRSGCRAKAHRLLPASERPRDLAQRETGPESVTEMYVYVSVLDVNRVSVQRRRSVRGMLGSTARARGRFHRKDGAGSVGRTQQTPAPIP